VSGIVEKKLKLSVKLKMGNVSKRKGRIELSSKYLSTTALSKEINFSAKELFNLLENEGYIKREENGWLLTDIGKNKGGIIKKHPQHGSYIAWNESIKSDSLFNSVENEMNLLNATTLSTHFGVSRNRINPILSEIGLIQKSVKGWVLTKLGESLGGKQFEHHRTGIPYVSWNENIINNKRIIETMKEIVGENVGDTVTTDKIEKPKIHNFRDKFEAKLRTADGHYVRSRAEMLIDNWLYMSELVHAYERKLPVEEDVYCDFYLPVGKVYIEYWGLENDEKYRQRKIEKLGIYQKYGFKLIEIEDSDIQNIDDILPKKLLKFGIQTY
jgi:ribosomal protein S19E (S16A)